MRSVRRPKRCHLYVPRWSGPLALFELARPARGTEVVLDLDALHAIQVCGRYTYVHMLHSRAFLPLYAADLLKPMALQDVCTFCVKQIEEVDIQGRHHLH
jgi:hypothetical protein